MIKLFDKCPACGGVVAVTECQCTNCHLQMRGEFRTGEFTTLSEDQLTFVKVFLRARGNLTEVEKVLGISYPTIRNKLDEINSTLDRAEGASESIPSQRAAPTKIDGGSKDQSRKEILRQVAAGELDAADALQRLQKSKGAE
jgi:hypothetical protein